MMMFSCFLILASIRALNMLLSLPLPASFPLLISQLYSRDVSRASSVTAHAAMSNLLLSHDGYSFHSVFKEDFNLHALYADTVKMEDVETLSNEIIMNATRRLEDVVRD